MKTMQEEKIASRVQLEKLNSAKGKEWKEVQNSLMEAIARLLHGTLKKDESGRAYLSGGYTLYGAHSEREVGGDALYHYFGMVVEKLFDGSCEWKAENSLEDQLKEMAGLVIDEAVKAYRKQLKEDERLGVNSTPVAIDVEWLGEDDGLADVSSDHRHQEWEAICEAADGDQELEAFVQVTGECKSLKEVGERLHLRDGERDKLMKRLKRRVKKKKSYP